MTADLITGGSGLLSYYIPPVDGSMKRQINEDESNLFVSVIAKRTRSTKVQTLGVPVRFMTEVLRKWNSTVQV